MDDEDSTGSEEALPRTVRAVGTGHGSFRDLTAQFGDGRVYDRAELTGHSRYRACP